MVRGISGYLTVEWDNGNRGKYRYGAESGAKDVRMVDEPRMLPPGMMVAVGVRARRGMLIIPWIHINGYCLKLDFQKICLRFFLNLKKSKSIHDLIEI